MTTTPASSNPTDLTLVLAGTGKTGRRVAERLTALGWPVRIGSRAARAAFDWERPATWAPVLEGASRAYVSYVPDLAFPGAAETIADFADLAVAAGVDRLVLLSGRGEESAERAEHAVQESGAHWTIVRSSWFMQNFSEDFLLEPVRSAVLAFPGGNVAEPFIDLADLADVAVAALTQPGHDKEIYEVTGPRLMTFAEAAASIAAAAGRRIEYVPISPEDYAAGAIEDGLSPELAHALAELFATVLDGRNAHLADGVRRALGREPRDFSHFARDAAAAGIWSAS
jgi:uncharacterized protein YbjT (DUF2867 family)